MKEYVLKWSDEFDYVGLPNPEKWNYDIGQKKWGNGELQFYTDGRNSRVENGILRILGVIEEYEGAPYTSARLTTYQRKHFQYGRLEISAKIPKAKGSWPAIWMLPVEIKEKHVPWPRCGEIDIMEHVTHLWENIHVSLHTEHFNHIARTQRTHFEKIDGVTDVFHEYAFDWTTEYIEFFIDKKSFAKYYKNQEGYTQDETGWPFDKPYYLILNQAIGGTWGGDVAVQDYPSPFDIQYVRYYEIIEK